MSEPRLGRVTQVTPLRVQLNGDATDGPAVAMADFTGATADASTGTEVFVQTVERRRLAWRMP